MKNIAIFLLAAFVFAASAQQNPIPIPFLDLNKLSGPWYVSVGFGGYVDGLTCYQANISVQENQGFIAEAYQFSDSDYEETLQYNITNVAGSAWNTYGEGWNWVAADLVGYQWAVFAAVETQDAMVFSRNLNVSNAVLNGVLILLGKEGYNTSSANLVTIPNTNCSSTYVY